MFNNTKLFVIANYLTKKTNCKSITRASITIQKITDSDIRTNGITWQDFQVRQSDFLVIYSL